MKKIKASLLWGILFLALVGFWAYENNRNSNFVRAVVLSTDNSDVMQSGIARIGSQELLLKVVDGKFKGQEVVGYNNLLGNLDIDAFYAPGDTVVAALREDHGKVVDAKAVDLYRQSWEFILFGFLFFCSLFMLGIQG